MPKRGGGGDDEPEFGRGAKAKAQKAAAAADKAAVSTDFALAADVCGLTTECGSHWSGALCWLGLVRVASTPRPCEHSSTWTICTVPERALQAAERKKAAEEDAAWQDGANVRALKKREAAAAAAAERDARKAATAAQLAAEAEQLKHVKL